MFQNMKEHVRSARMPLRLAERESFNFTFTLPGYRVTASAVWTNGSGQTRDDARADAVLLFLDEIAGDPQQLDRLKRIFSV